MVKVLIEGRKELMKKEMAVEKKQRPQQTIRDREKWLAKQGVGYTGGKSVSA